MDWVRITLLLRGKFKCKLFHTYQIFIKSYYKVQRYDHRQG